MKNSKKFIGLSVIMTLALSSLTLVRSLLNSRRTAPAVPPAEEPAYRPAEIKPESVPAAACGEAAPAPAEAAKEERAAEPGDKRTDINTASAQELEALPGIGPSTAEAIIKCRQELGGFKKIEDITETPGIGPAKFKSFRELIRVGDIK